MFLYHGIDQKIDKDLRISQTGTPALDMLDDMPSPPPQKNSKSMALLPCSSEVEDDEKDKSKKDGEDIQKNLKKRDFRPRDYLGEIHQVSQ